MKRVLIGFELYSSEESYFGSPEVGEEICQILSVDLVGTVTLEAYCSNGMFKEKLFSRLENKKYMKEDLMVLSEKRLNFYESNRSKYGY